MDSDGKRGYDNPDGGDGIPKGVVTLGCIEMRFYFIWRWQGWPVEIRCQCHTGR